AEARLTKVVACTENEGAPDLLGFREERGERAVFGHSFEIRRELDRDALHACVTVAAAQFDPAPRVVETALRDFVEVEIHDERRLLELRAASEQRALRVEDERAAIEDE